jgi:hypothetical protein
MQAANRESQIRAPWFSLNGIAAAFLIERAREDPVASDAWRAAATRIFEQSDAGIRTQRLIALFEGDVERFAREVAADWPVFTGRLDYPALALLELADARLGFDLGVLDDLIPYAEERSIRFITGPARRLRALIRQDPEEMRLAVEVFEAMGATAFLIRARGELAILTGDREAADAAVVALEHLGDIRQARRLAADARAGTIAMAPTGGDLPGPAGVASAGPAGEGVPTPG